MTELAIETTDLTKSFQGRPAVNGLTMRVPVGGVCGFLGRNGAGKTTTIKLMMGMLKADGGTVSVLGKPLSSASEATRIRGRIGFVTEDKELYPYMTVQQVIRFIRGFFPRWRDDLERRYLKMFDLPLRRNLPDLSKGMKSKLMLLLAMSRGAELLILDEPTDGLDPVSVEELLRELVSLSAQEGTTIFFSSHQLSEVEQIADQIIIMDRSRCVLTGELDDLKERYQRVNVVLDQPLATPIRWLEGVDRVITEGRILSLLVSNNLSAVLAQAQSVPGATVEVSPVTFKELFLEYAREA